MNCHLRQGDNRPIGEGGIQNYRVRLALSFKYETGD